MVEEKYEQSSRLIQTSWIFSCNFRETKYTWKVLKLNWDWETTRRSWRREFIWWVTLTLFFQSVLCFGWKKCSQLKQTASRKDVLLIMSDFRFYSGVESTFGQISATRNRLLSAYRCCEDRLFYLRWDKTMNLMEVLVLWTRIWGLFFLTPKHLDYSQNTWCCSISVDTLWWRLVTLLHH